MDSTEMKQGLAFAAAGLCVVVAAVLLFGLTTATGAIDVVSVITGVAGGTIVASGLYRAFHHPRPHPSA
jgi:isoprenylcysteine carboxyl methyltransferase (ICMT) family protein YpbQ